MTYGALAGILNEEGLALQNLASRPHISVAEAAATATHGSGVTCGDLATRGSPASGPLFATYRKARLPRRADLIANRYARLSYRQADTLWKAYTPVWDLHQLRYTAISIRAAHGYTEVDLKLLSRHTSLRSLERYIANNREMAKRKAREWERRQD